MKPSMTVQAYGEDLRFRDSSHSRIQGMKIQRVEAAGLEGSGCRVCYVDVGSTEFSAWGFGGFRVQGFEVYEASGSGLTDGIGSRV